MSTSQRKGAKHGHQFMDVMMKNFDDEKIIALKIWGQERIIGNRLL